MADKKVAPPPTIVTLTLPDADAEPATLLIQRGDLAHVRLFPRRNEDGETIDIHAIIEQAYASLAVVESAPPVIPAPPPPPPAAPRPASTYVPPKREPVEPTIDIPLAKGKQSIKQSHLHLVGEQTDAAAMQTAILIAGKLIDGKLWDGKSPIGIDDVAGVQKRLKYLAAKDLMMFSLEDFAQRVEVKAPAPAPEPTVEEEVRALLEEDDAGEEDAQTEDDE